MITGGNVTVIVSNMDRAVEFYTHVLGLKLTNRFGDHWATVEAGKGLTIGLHPESPQHPAAGTKGAMMIGLEIDEKIESVVDRLADQGLRLTGPIIRAEPGAWAGLEDPDGNVIYLWEVNKELIPNSGLEHAAP
jgi:predicted enzyme related to lactoylglutathione lyase